MCFITYCVLHFSVHTPFGTNGKWYRYSRNMTLALCILVPFAKHNGTSDTVSKHSTLRIGANNTLYPLRGVSQFNSGFRHCINSKGIMLRRTLNGKSILHANLVIIATWLLLSHTIR